MWWMLREEAVSIFAWIGMRPHLLDLFAAAKGTRASPSEGSVERAGSASDRATPQVAVDGGTKADQTWCLHRSAVGLWKSDGRWERDDS